MYISFPQNEEVCSNAGMAKVKKNKNEVLVTAAEIDAITFMLDDLEFKDEFRFLCKLHPNVARERLEIVDAVNEKAFNIRRPALLYIFSIGGKILKIGASMTSLKGRIGSYNCGTLSNRLRGTCSTTNFFVLQSLLKYGQDIDVHLFFIPTVNHDVFGTSREIPHNPKYWENVILAKLKKEGRLPLFCTQR